MNRIFKRLPLLFIPFLVLSACKKLDPEPTEPAVLVSPYKLEKTHTIGIPVGNPTGIATDQTNIWIMSGNHNGDLHLLTHIDPINGTILEQFSYTNLIEVLGTGVYGITWDGTNVWISVSGQMDKIVKVDPQNGDILQTFSSPTTLGPSDLEWNDGRIWISSGTGKIYSMDAATGASELMQSDVGTANRDSGITCRAGELWIGNLFNGDINIYSAADFSHRGVIVNAVKSRNNFCFHNGQLMALSPGGISFYDVVI